jgi:hypothetical protein
MKRSKPSIAQLSRNLYSGLSTTTLLGRWPGTALLQRLKVYGVLPDEFRLTKRRRAAALQGGAL